MAQSGFIATMLSFYTFPLVENLLLGWAGVFVTRLLIYSAEFPKMKIT